jgi:type II secretory pathway pseudopilin PulG
MTCVKDSRFTLIEMVTVAGIIGLLAILTLPSFMQARVRAQNGSFLNDLRVATDAFVLHNLENGGYPPAAVPREEPLGMVGYLNRLEWDEPTVIGGYWDWDNDEYWYQAGLAVVDTPAAPIRMKDIDAIIDDGLLGSGSFQTRTGNAYVYIIQF